jgi:hypothetical protein
VGFFEYVAEPTTIWSSKTLDEGFRSRLRHELELLAPQPRWLIWYYWLLRSINELFRPALIRRDPTDAHCVDFLAERLQKACVALVGPDPAEWRWEFQICEFVEAHLAVMVLFRFQAIEAATDDAWFVFHETIVFRNGNSGYRAIWSQESSE